MAHSSETNTDRGIEADIDPSGQEKYVGKQLRNRFVVTGEGTLPPQQTFMQGVPYQKIITPNSQILRSVNQIEGTAPYVHYQGNPIMGVPDRAVPVKTDHCMGAVSSIPQGIVNVTPGVTPGTRQLMAELSTGIHSAGQVLYRDGDRGTVGRQVAPLYFTTPRPQLPYDYMNVCRQEQVSPMIYAPRTDNANVIASNIGLLEPHGVMSEKGNVPQMTACSRHTIQDAPQAKDHLGSSSRQRTPDITLASAVGELIQVNPLGLPEDSFLAPARRLELSEHALDLIRGKLANLKFAIAQVDVPGMAEISGTMTLEGNGALSPLEVIPSVDQVTAEVTDTQAFERLEGLTADNFEDLIQVLKQVMCTVTAQGACVNALNHNVEKLRQYIAINCGRIEKAERRNAEELKKTVVVIHELANAVSCVIKVVSEQERSARILEVTEDGRRQQSEHIQAVSYNTDAYLTVLSEQLKGIGSGLKGLTTLIMPMLSHFYSTTYRGLHTEKMHRLQEISRFRQEWATEEYIPQYNHDYNHEPEEGIVLTEVRQELPPITCQNSETLEQTLPRNVRASICVINIPPNNLSPFFGRLGDNFEDWVKLFQMFSNAADWPTEKLNAILGTYMRDAAQEAYQALSPDIKNGSFQELIEELAKQLQPVELEKVASRKLLVRRQQVTETVSDYAWSVQRLVRQAYPTMDTIHREQVMLNHFVEGLQDRYRKHILYKDPQNFKQAVEMAQKYEIFEQPGSNRPRVAVNAVDVEPSATIESSKIAPVVEMDVKPRESSQVQDQSSLERICAVMDKALAKTDQGKIDNSSQLGGQLDMLSRQMGVLIAQSAEAPIGKPANIRGREGIPEWPKQNSCTGNGGFRNKDQNPTGSSKTQVQCFKCSRFGHMARNCTAGIVPARGSNVNCFKCGKPGHIARHCRQPTAQKTAYEQYSAKLERPAYLNSRGGSRTAGPRATPLNTAGIQGIQPSAGRGRSQESQANKDNARETIANLQADVDALLAQNHQYARMLGQGQAKVNMISLQTSQAKRSSSWLRPVIWFWLFSGFAWITMGLADTRPLRSLVIPTAQRTHQFFQDSIADYPMLCQTHQSGVTWRLPGITSCQVQPLKGDPPVPTLIQIYKRNYIQYKSKAVKCIKKKQTKSTFMYFFENERLQTPIETHDVPLTQGECYRMRKFRQCSEGPLMQRGTVWTTAHKLDWHFGGGGHKCCRWKHFETTNCYMHEAYVYVRYGAQMESTADDVSHCYYRDGGCKLKDGGYLLWDILQEERCRYLRWKEIRGQMAGESWISDDGTMALTTKEQEFAKDCDGNYIRMSDQGVPFRVLTKFVNKARYERYKRNPESVPLHLQGQKLQPLNETTEDAEEFLENTLRNYHLSLNTSHEEKDARKKRETAEDKHGIVTTDQLAATAQALEIRMNRQVRQTFERALTQACNNMRVLSEIAKAEIIADPILTMRTLLGRSDVYAAAGGGMAQVWPCQEIVGGNITFKSMNQSCTKEIPIEFEFQGESRTGFLDPVTNIIYSQGKLISCELVREIPVRVFNQSFTYYSKDGSLKQQQIMPVLNVFNWDFASPWIYEPTVFKQVILYNWTELHGSMTMQDIIQGIKSQQELFQQFAIANQGKVNGQQGSSFTADAVAEGIVRKGFLGFLSGYSVDIKQIWMFLVGLYVTICFCLIHCCPIFQGQALAVNIPNAIGTLYNRWAKDRGSEQSQEVQSSRSRRVSTHTLPPPSQPHQGDLYMIPEVEEPPSTEIAQFTPIELIPPPMPLLYPKVHKTESEYEATSNKKRITMPTLQSFQFTRAKPTAPTKESINIITEITPTATLIPNVKVVARIQGVPMVTMIDTGATLTIMDRGAFLGLPNIPTELENAQLQVNSYTGHAVKILGVADIHYEIGDHSFWQRTYIAEGTDQTSILGMDCLSKFGHLSINFENRTVALWSSWNWGWSKPVYTEVDMRCDDIPIIAKICITNTEVIPARTQAIIPCQVVLSQDQEKACFGPFMVNPRNTTYDRYGVFVGRSYQELQLNNILWVNVVNPGMNSVTLPNQAVIATAETADVINEAHKAATENDWPVDLEKIGLDLSECTLTPEQTLQLKSLLLQYHQVFAKEKYDYGRTTVVKHFIDVQGHEPIKQRMYRIPHHMKDVVRTEITEMADKGIIRKSNSPWASPIVLVRKKDNSVRMCIDYRNTLNKVTKKLVYPLPRIDDILESLGSARYYSTLDLISGYWQVEINESDKEKTAFTSFMGLWEFEVLPFGISNAPATFQRLMDFVLTGLQYESALVYIDDIIIYSPTFDKHLEHLSEVFNRLLDANLKLKLKKCLFARESVPFLGHVVNHEGIAPDPAKVKKVQEFPPPANLTLLRSFLGLASYYRRFIPQFSIIAAPLLKLLKKETRFYWSPECQKAFSDLKELLTTAPLLAYPNYSERFYVQTDACQTGLGAVLSQRNSNGKDQPIAYASRALTKAERNYSVIDLEALAIVYAIKTFKPYLYGRPFTCVTDHQPLRYIMEQPNPTGRLARWAMQLMEYDITVEYRPGRANRNADALSRMYEDNSANEPASNQAVSMVQAAQRQDNQTRQEIRQEQLKDGWTAPMIKYLESGELPGDLSQSSEVALTSPRYTMIDQVLYHLFPKPQSKRAYRDTMFWQICVPLALRAEIMRAHHNDPFSGHLGTRKTYLKILKKYYWPSMHVDIQQWCQGCVICQARNRPGRITRASLKPITVKAPFELLGLDICGPLPTTHNGNKYIIVCCEYLTHWVEAFAVPDIRAVTVAQVLVEGIVCRHGSPQKLLTDRGANLMASVIYEVCEILQTHKIFTTAFHPQTNGLVERQNRTLKSMIAAYTNEQQTNWDDYLNYVLFAYRTSTQSTMEESSFYLLYGRDPVLPAPYSEVHEDIFSDDILDPKVYAAEVSFRLNYVWKIAGQILEQGKETVKARYDRKAVDRNYQVNDKVMVLRNPQAKKGLTRKLQSHYLGPYRITAVKYPIISVKPENAPHKKSRWVHVNRTKPIKQAYVLELPSHDQEFQIEEEPLAEDDLELDNGVSSESE